MPSIAGCGIGPTFTTGALVRKTYEARASSSCCAPQYIALTRFAGTPVSRSAAISYMRSSASLVLSPLRFSVASATRILDAPSEPQRACRKASRSSASLMLALPR